MKIERSITIEAPASAVFKCLNDYTQWVVWSPWLIQEPGAQVNVSEDKKSYEWIGDRIGTGNMKITSEIENKEVVSDLQFMKPWKSKAKVKFELLEQDNHTTVTWFMQSKLPIFLFWMKKMMEAYVGMDYDRGLNMLKDYVEHGQVHSNLDFVGYEDYPGCKYVGIKTTTNMDAMGVKMQQDFEQLWSYMQQDISKVAGKAFTIYHKWDMVNNKVIYTSGVPVSSLNGQLPAGLLQGEIPQTNTYALRHTGPYIHLGNAWSTLFNIQRAKTFKSNKKIDPFEVYENSPGEVPDNDLVTQVYFPVK